jgi:hypothetical protein
VAELAEAKTALIAYGVMGARTIPLDTLLLPYQVLNAEVIKKSQSN